MVSPPDGDFSGISPRKQPFFPASEEITSVQFTTGDYLIM